MFRFVRRFAVAMTVLAAVRTASGAEPEIRTLTLSPTPSPVPALRYRFLPLKSELNPGNAVPMYLRLTMELSPEALQDLKTTPETLNTLPFDQFPKEEGGAAGKFVTDFAGRFKLLEFGAFRETAQWDHPVAEQREECFQILLPDVQAVRVWSRAISVKARYEIKRHEFEKAARTIETGMAMGGHVSKAPFLISWLVGNAFTRQMLSRVEEWVGEPDSPNLYWALTTLPNPCINIRDSLEHEYKTMEWMLPEMADLDRSRTPAEWEARLASFHQRLMKIREMYDQPEKPDTSQDRLLDFKTAMLPRATAFLKERFGDTQKFGDDQAILVYHAMMYHELYDDVYKATYLPVTQYLPTLEAGSKRLMETKPYGPLWLFPRLVANVDTGRRSEARLDTEIAALRVIEAIRLHAKVEGSLPASLDAIKIVPVPNSPVSGKPFAYALKDGTAELTAIDSAYVRGKTVIYRLSLRSPGK